MTVPEKVPIRVRVFGSVRFRLAVAVVLVVGVTLFAGGTLLVKWVEATLIGELRSRNERMVSFLAESLARDDAPAALFAPVNQLEDQKEDVRTLLGVSSNEWEVLSNTYFYLEGRGLANTFARDEQGRTFLFGRSGPPRKVTQEMVDVKRDVYTQQGVVTIHAVTPVNEIDRSVGALTGALALGLPMLTLGAGMMTWVITGLALAPVRTMTRRVRELTATNLDARVPVPPTADEISLLATTMNEMLDRLQHASIAQRQFVSDASHELRSPVASIRAQLETALRYPDEVDWPSVAQIVLAEDERLEHLVGNLLAMARLEEGRRGPRSEIDLDELVMAQTKRLTEVKLDLSGVSGGRVWGNPNELTSVIRNLLDNAARYARAKITVSVSDYGPWVTLKVSDDGPGIAAEYRESIFKRFARLQEGRERDMGGTGLGLALSRRIVEQHNGEIFVQDSEGGGSTFVVRLPSVEWTGSHQAVEPESEEPQPNQSAAGFQRD